MSDLTYDVERFKERMQRALSSQEEAQHINDLIDILLKNFRRVAEDLANEAEASFDAGYDEGYDAGRADLEMELMECEDRLQVMTDIADSFEEGL